MTNNELKEYNELYTRNSGYISEALQEKIRTTRILIAGCGVGSPIAEACVRLGFVNLLLADLDVVEKHNLNRQSYIYSDIGTPKVEALERRLKAINPNVSITKYPEGITKENVKEAVQNSDFIFDTIDFIVMSTIVMLHDEAHAQGKPLITGTTAGWGAALIYFPQSDTPYCDFRKLFGLPLSGDVGTESYTDHYKAFLGSLKDELDPIIVEVMAKALTVMEDGKPCPASQVSVGSASLAALAATFLVRILNGEQVTPSPHVIISNLSKVAKSEGVDLGK
jgi:molybdopterin/thiamine biosynthesis adenylyltransferase